MEITVAYTYYVVVIARGFIIKHFIRLIINSPLSLPHSRRDPSLLPKTYVHQCALVRRPL